MPVREKMKELIFVLKYVFVLSLLPVFIVSSALAEEKIIQQEKITFDRCLEVIKTSESKLYIAPEITTLADQKRIAVFTLVDGTLSITCDGSNDLLTVTTNTN